LINVLDIIFRAIVATIVTIATSCELDSYLWRCVLDIALFNKVCH